MVTNKLNRLSIGLFVANCLIMLPCLFFTIYFENYSLIFIPFVVLIGSIVFIDFKKLFYLLFFLLPLSVEIYLPNGLGTDLPTEPLIIFLTLVFIIYILHDPKKFDNGFLKDPIIQLLILHFVWIGIVTIYSSVPMISVKFLLAKSWYLITFVFLGGMIVKGKREFKTIFWCVFIPLFILVLYILVRFALYDFAFSNVNKPMSPFFRNHVTYAALLVAFYPFCWLASTWYPRGSIKRMILNFSKVLFVVCYLFFLHKSFMACFTYSACRIHHG